jgi:hypothetical protein
MAEQEKVAMRKIKVKNTHPQGHRFVNEAGGKQHVLGPGQSAEVELPEPEAKRLEEVSKSGSGQGLVVEGHEPEKEQRAEGAPEVPKEHESRTALAEKETELMQAGQEADKERREKDAKKSGVQLAAETGIHMHARGLEPEVVASAPDSPPKKK